jgi:hypothetical protein
LDVQTGQNLENHRLNLSFVHYQKDQWGHIFQLVFGLRIYYPVCFRKDCCLVQYIPIYQMDY